MRETQCLLIQGMSFLINNASLDMSVQINEYALECSGSWNLDLLLQNEGMEFSTTSTIGKHVRSQSHQGFISQVSSFSKSLISAKC